MAAVQDDDGGVGGVGVGEGDEAATDWSEEHRFEVVVAVPAVRISVADCMSRARAPMSADEFLSGFATDLPRTFERAFRRGADRGRDFGERMGLRTAKSRDGRTAAPIGHAIAWALCSLAARAQRVRSVEQAEDGCTLIAAIPSDRRSFGGELRISLRRGGDGGTEIHAEAEIPGQLYDWGTSKKTLAALFADLGATTDSSPA
jgi:hypothetical protein